MNYNGFLLVDKISGETSFDIIRKVRKSLNMRKVGHAGTLDPLATGLMIVAVGNATRYLQYLLKKDKTYIASITLGAVSDTADADGDIHSYGNHISAPDIITAQNTLDKYVGVIEQVPPRYSALKISGQKACDLARQGIVIKMKPRTIEIYSINMLKYDYPLLDIDVSVSSGTYIRSLATDIGVSLDTGGYISALRRTSIGKFTLDKAISSEDISSLGESISEYFIPPRDIFVDMTQVNISSDDVSNISYGRSIPCSTYSTDFPIFAYHNDTLVASGKYENNIFIPSTVAEVGYHSK